MLQTFDNYFSTMYFGTICLPRRKLKPYDSYCENLLEIFLALVRDEIAKPGAIGVNVLNFLEWKRPRL